MSPAGKAYLDMKYNPSTSLGQNWAGYIEVQEAYTWDPANQVAGVFESDVLGVEAPLWTETIQTMADIEYMALPRLAGYAEIGWSAATGRSWDEYKTRLGAHGPRLIAMGVNFYRSQQVPWE
jgi:hexosaminidase